MSEKEKNKTNKDNIPKNIPRCIGIIMDGNRRWAREEGITLAEGHKKGYQKMKEVIRWGKEAGIEYVIFYAFSTENWNRGKEEVSYLMELFKYAFSTGYESLLRNKVRIKIIGDISAFSPDIQELMKKAEADTAHFERTIVLAMSYGGRAEILNAVKKLSKDKTKEEIKDMKEADFSDYLYTKDIPDPDIIIRTSGEMRLSGFLPWQGVYSELFFLKTSWPPLSKEEFLGVLEEYSSRERRHGK
ncbi:MAG TPA: polyprenyl diphosphate synthase [Candidatus Paceibacterota bacterium]|jgi:undecaprenyl diphosphate synthase|nr:polyprenyl diphosphate synthase [Candidatus Paceibacterota bacterium]